MYNRLSINKYFLLNKYKAVNTFGQSPLNHLQGYLNYLYSFALEFLFFVFKCNMYICDKILLTNCIEIIK